MYRLYDYDDFIEHHWDYSTSPVHISFRILWTKKKGDYWQFSPDEEPKFFQFRRQERILGNHEYILCVGRFSIGFTQFFKYRGLKKDE